MPFHDEVDRFDALEVLETDEAAGPLVLGLLEKLEFELESACDDVEQIRVRYGRLEVVVGTVPDGLDGVTH